MDLNNISLASDFTFTKIWGAVFIIATIVTIIAVFKNEPRNKTDKAETIAIFGGLSMLIFGFVTLVTAVNWEAGTSFAMDKVANKTQQEVLREYNLNISHGEALALLTSSENNGYSYILYESPSSANGGVFSFYQLGIDWESKTLPIIVNGELKEVYLANNANGKQELYDTEKSTPENRVPIEKAK